MIVSRSADDERRFTPSHKSVATASLGVLRRTVHKARHLHPTDQSVAELVVAGRAASYADSVAELKPVGAAKPTLDAVVEYLELVSLVAHDDAISVPNRG